MKVIICKGIPASGKTTWAKQFCKDNRDYVRINRDDLRNMRGHYWMPEDEQLITNWERTLIVEAMRYGKNLVIDATNLNEFNLYHLEEHIKDVAINIFNEEPIIEEKIFDTPLEVCIERDKSREQSVGENIIRKFHTKYIIK